MCRYCGSDRKWAEQTLEKITIGDPTDAIWKMCEYCGSNKEWAKQALEKVTVNNHS